LQGERLAADLNAFWRERIAEEFELESHLEIEFETLYLRFFMPTIRGAETGSKKRYAGLVRRLGGAPELQVKGLESVRTDWTPLARGFQREILRRVFSDEPFEDYIREVADDLLTGKLDKQLFYRKRIRRALDAYEKNVPPHVQAARKLERPGRWVSYAITLNGPEPEEALNSPLDYAHYLERQLAPAVDGILHCLGTRFDKIAGRQMEMF
jgi:DNA polymerase II